MLGFRSAVEMIPGRNCGVTPMAYASDAPVVFLSTAEFDIGICAIADLIDAGQFCADTLGESVDAVDPRTGVMLATFAPIRNRGCS